METPNTLAGRTTEKIMRAIVKRRPLLLSDTHAYNQTYSAVLECLEREMAQEIPPESAKALDEAIAGFRERVLPGGRK